MEFNSLSFLIFFPAFVLIYSRLSQKYKPAWILMCSLYFYMCWNYKYVVLLLAVILLNFFGGLLIEGRDKKAQKVILFFDIFACIGVLFFFKYFEMFLDTVKGISGFFGAEVGFNSLDLLLPVGISFYIFQALGYTIDVYRGDIKAERNIISFGAFVTFFPQLVAGPIERSKNLLRQINDCPKIEREKIYSGFFQMLWGYFQKVIIADRIAVIVSQIYDNYSEYPGIYLLVATILFAFQVYCDFGGYSNIAIGAARILGFELMENFNAPYQAIGIADFWNRWHISLSQWLRDYVYIPLGGNRLGKKRKCTNLLCTFLISGIWHGANWTYVVWGGLHGIYRVVEEIIRDKFPAALKRCPVIILQAITFILVDFAWLFFRADSLTDAMSMISKIVTDLQLSEMLNRELAISLRMQVEEILILMLSLCALLVFDHYKHRICFGSVVIKKPAVLRWGIIYACIFGLLIFGYYGPGFNAAQFIYFQF